MKGLLHSEAISVDHEESLNRIAYDIFNEMYSQCQKAARYGLKSIKVRFDEFPSCRWIPPNSWTHVKDRVLKLILSEDLLQSNSPDIIELSWAKAPQRVPILRASDLIQAGYPINEERYGTILRELTRAMAEGHVPGRTLQAELLWIKSAFPI